jgi:hypothetical protein
MKTLYTPGPWNVQKLGIVRHYFEINAKGAWIADVKGPSQNEQGEANARLIAAAPEMLEALQEAYKELQFHNWHNTTTGMLIERAIDKATQSPQL